MIIVPIGSDYTCPHCNTVTSHYATKLQCDCHIYATQAIIFGGVVTLPACSDATETEEDTTHTTQKGTQP